MILRSPTERWAGRAVVSIIAPRFGNAAMDTLQEKQQRLHLLRQHGAWFGMRGDVAMQQQLAVECDGIRVDIDQLERIGRSPEEPQAPY
jgi:hypothetical protein